MTDIPITVDGVSLNTLAFNVETLDGRLQFPSVRGANPEVPGMDGAIFVPNKDWDDKTITLKMWVRGAKTNGDLPVNNRNRLSQFRSNLKTLSQLFGKRHALLDIRQSWPDNTDVQWLGEVTDSFDLSASAMNPKAGFAVSIKVPGVFGQDVNTTDYASATGLTSGTTVTLSAYDGGTGPISDGIIVVRGAGTNPRLTNPDTGEWVQLNSTISTGTDWRLDCGSWDTRTGSSLGLAGGAGTNQVANTQFSGGGARFIRLTPKDGGPQLVLTGSGFNGSTQILARARRKFLL